MKISLSNIDAKIAFVRAIHSAITELEKKVQDHTISADKLVLPESRDYFNRRVKEYNEAIQEIKTLI